MLPKSETETEVKANLISKINDIGPLGSVCLMNESECCLVDYEKFREFSSLEVAGLDVKRIYVYHVTSQVPKGCLERFGNWLSGQDKHPNVGQGVEELKRELKVRDKRDEFKDLEEKVAALQMHIASLESAISNFHQPLQRHNSHPIRTLSSAEAKLQKTIRRVNSVQKVGLATEVKCCYTDALFKVIDSRKEDQVQAFVQWANALVDKLEQGKNVCLALDCEGVDLGMCHDSLVAVQMGQIFNDDYDIFSDEEVPKIGPSSGGMIVVFPACEEVKQSMTKLLTHEKIWIATFDFTGDLSSILDAGVKVNMNRVIDAQLDFDSAVLEKYSYLTKTTFDGISSVLKKLKDNDLGELELMRRAREGKNRINWTAIFFVLEHDKSPKASMLNEELLRYAAGDVAMTGLMLKRIILSHHLQFTLQHTKAKVEEFLSHGQQSILRPSQVRQYAFAKGGALKSLTKISTEKIRADWRQALPAWSVTHMITTLYQAAPDLFSDGRIDIGFVRERHEIASQVLNRNVRDVRRRVNLIDIV